MEEVKCEEGTRGPSLAGCEYIKASSEGSYQCFLSQTSQGRSCKIKAQHVLSGPTLGLGTHRLSSTPYGSQSC